MEQQRDVREEALAFFRARPDVNPVTFMAHTNLGESTGRHFLSGTVKPSPDVESEVRRVLRLAKAGDILTPGQRTVTITEGDTTRVRRVRQAHGVYVTETVKRVAQVLDYCAEHAAIGVVTADYGVGKTEAVRLWRTRPGQPESVVYEFNEFSAKNSVYFMERLARTLGVEVGRRGAQNGGRMFDTVCESLRERPVLLILDQCEVVVARVLQIVRQIWDATRDAGVGIVMLSAPVLIERLAMGRIKDLGALSSRVGIYAQLRGLSEQEMAAVIREEQIAEVAPEALKLWWRAVGGSMRRLIASVELIQSRHAGRRIVEKHIVQVASHLWGMAIPGVE